MKHPSVVKLEEGLERYYSNYRDAVLGQIEDFQWLLDAGESLELAYSRAVPGRTSRFFYRYGYPELARLVRTLETPSK